MKKSTSVLSKIARIHCKTYWSLLKILDNGKRASLIPPIQIGDKFVTRFTGKAEVFNDYFAKQCSVIDNNGQIPDCNDFCTNERLNKNKFVNANMSKILKNLDITEMIVSNLN